jgi:3-oxoacyl-[acyl-carrier protein] reductase
MDLGIRDRVALVTGASEGLGFASALALAEEGARLAIAARRPEGLEVAARNLLERSGADVLAVPCNVARLDDVRQFVSRAAEYFDGRLDILVCNAGGPPVGRALDLDDGQWQHGFELTLRSVVALCRAAVPYMRHRKWGRIVAITSTSAREPIDGLTLSNAMRPAVHGYLKTLSRELGPNRILVNAVCPGGYLTARHRELLSAWAADQGTTPEALLEQREAAIPLRRLGEPIELGRVVAFLCSEAASYLSGVSLPVDGGLCRGLL